MDWRLHKKIASNIVGISGINVKKVGKYLGSGIEGYVFEYGKTRVIKINLNPHDGEKWVYAEKRLRKIRDGRPEGVVRVYRYGELIDGWYVVMERLSKLSNREAKLFRGKLVGIREEEVVKELEFYGRLGKIRREMGLVHGDLLHFNVMKSVYGDWKAIDPESFDYALEWWDGKAA